MSYDERKYARSAPPHPHYSHDSLIRPYYSPSITVPSKYSVTKLELGSSPPYPHSHPALFSKSLPPSSSALSSSRSSSYPHPSSSVPKDPYESRTNEKTGFDRFSDPHYSGPGIWYSIHTDALDAKTPEKIKYFIEFTKNKVNKLRCLDCRKHGQDYIAANDPMSYINDIIIETGEHIGMFKWSFNYHNAVNARLKKPIVDWKSAYDFWSNPDLGSCSESCGDKHGVEVIVLDETPKKELPSSITTTTTTGTSPIIFPSTDTSSTRGMMTKTEGRMTKTEGRGGIPSLIIFN